MPMPNRIVLRPYAMPRHRDRWILWLDFGYVLATALAMVIAGAAYALV